MLRKRKKYDESRSVLMKLSNTECKNLAILELGRLEKMVGNYNGARKHLKVYLTRLVMNMQVLN